MSVARQPSAPTPSRGLTNSDERVYALTEASGAMRPRAASGNRVLETLRCLSESSMRGMEFPKQVSDGDNRPTSRSALLIQLLIRSAPHGDCCFRDQSRFADPA